MTSKGRSGDILVDALLRYANYFVVCGWQSVGDPDKLQFRITVAGASATPEFSFCHRGDEVGEYSGVANPKLGAEIRFFHCLWVNDGYRLPINAGDPAKITLISNEGE